MSSKSCPTCGRSAPDVEFYKDGRPECVACGKKAYMAAWNLKNRGKRIAYNAEYYAANRERLLAYQKDYTSEHKDQVKATVAKYNERTYDALWAKRLVLKYGITAEDYVSMLMSQDGLCAICRGVNPDGERLAVDHNHGTKRVRGLLCRVCNVMLGHATDSAERLRKAADYLDVDTNAAQ